MSQQQQTQPVLPPQYLKWIIKYSQRNYWRLATWYGLDDLIQEGTVCAYKCQGRYGVPGKDIDEPHFMRLLQTTFFNHMTDLVRKHMREVEVEILYGHESILLKAETPLQDFELLIAELPEYLRKVVEAHLYTPKKIRAMLRVTFNGEETMSDRLNKICGFPRDLDFEIELRAYLWEREQGLI